MACAPPTALRGALLVRLCGTTSAAALACILATPVAAQTASTAVDSASALEEVVVTGSRARRNGVDMPTPVTVTSAEQLQLGAPSTVSDALNQLPQFRGSSRPAAGTTTTNAAAGANLLNLRNLGSQRNLVLLDGRRMVAGTNTGVTDINTLPQALVQRVEVVTGGASAAYGSDAVAGVVNFILDTGFTGIKGEVAGGISQVWDSDSQKFNLTYGTPFAADRGHFVASAEYYRIDGVSPLDMGRRDWTRRTPGIVPNVPGTAIPNRFILDENVYVSSATYGGLITTGPLINTMFGKGGVPEPFIPGTLRSATFMVGGTPTRHDGNLTADLARWSLFAHAKYDLTDSIELYAQGSYSEADTDFMQAYNYTNATSAFTIFSGNPYLPAAIQSQMTAQNIASFRLGRLMGEGDMINAQLKMEVFQVVGGFKASLSDKVRIDGYYARGEAHNRVDNRNIMNFNRVYAAVDAVRDPATGNIVCRSTLLFGLHPGCVPLNVFGQGSPSTAAIDYYQGDLFRDLRVTQDVVALNLQADLFSLWSSPLSFATGVEYRRETSKQTVDDLSTTQINFTNVRAGPPAFVGQIGPFMIGNFKPLSGQVSVKEAYAELDVPLLRDAPLIHALGMNVAARLTNYSTSGNAFTWKVSGAYSPIEGLRFRATRSRDIRAANIAELFSGGSQTTGTIRDPQGVTQNQTGTILGNPDLDPEKADTLTVGFVYQPSWLSGLDVSLDYYNVKIKGAISALTPQGTVDACAAGSAVACANIQIISGAYRLTLPNLNLSLLESYGVDLEVGYRQPVGDGTLDLRALLNYQGRLRTTTPGAPPIDLAGEVGFTLTNSTNPKWLGAVTATYTRGPFTFFLQERYISKGIFSATFIEGVSVDDNSVPAVFYTDATVRYRMEKQGLELYATVNNVFDKDPPMVPQASASIIRNSNYQMYDAVGRYFTLGLKFQY